MATRMGWSPGPAAWKDDLDADCRRRLELRPRRAPAGPRGVRRHAGRDPEAGRRRPRARRPLARALREHPESEDAAVRRIGAVGSDAERVSRKAGPKRPIARRSTAPRWASTCKPAGNRPVQPVSDRFFYWLRATMLETRRLGYWWANRMLQTTHPRGAEDGAAVARPLRHPREQGPRLPQDDAADRPVRAGRDRQPARSDHQGRAEPGDAVLPRRAVQRQGRAERELRPRGDGALHHGRRQLLREGRARMRARVHRAGTSTTSRSRSTRTSTTAARRRSSAGPGTSTASTC